MIYDDELGSVASLNPTRPGWPWSPGVLHFDYENLDLPSPVVLGHPKHI